MKNRLKVLKLFTDNKGGKFTIKKAAETLKINYRIVYEEITALENDGLITTTRQGNSKVCGFNYKFDSKLVEIEEIRKKELFKNKDIELVCKRVMGVKSPFYVLVIFGSHASKTNAKKSDIDLCLISDDPEVSREANTILGITPLNVDFQEFTSKQFLAMIKSKEFNVGNEIVKNNVILYGMEGFYKLVNYVK